MNSNITVSTGGNPPRHHAGFSLIELLVSMTILSVLLAILMASLSAVSGLYIKSDDTTKAEEKGRAIIELISREVTPAVIDSRMQFAILPESDLTDAGAIGVADNSPAMIWMAPLGPGGELRCLGYFLTRDLEQKKHELKRIYIKDDNPHGYFPEFGDARDTAVRTSPTDAGWFTENWDEAAFDEKTTSNPKLIVSTVSDGAVAFWVQAIDAMGEPIPQLSSSSVHPASSLIFNSAAYFYMADGKDFDQGSTFVYLKKNRLTMKANRLPAALELAVVLISEDHLNRGEDVPVQESVLNESGALDLESSIRQYEETLRDAGFTTPRVFRTTVALTNGG